jgi:hypothetical protein
VTRSHRALLAALLSLLLLCMQQEGLRHALTHWTSALSSDQKQSLKAPVDAPCDECTLLAAGANGVASGLQLLPVAAITLVLVFWALRSSPLSPPSYYQSRAPPSLL